MSTPVIDKNNAVFLFLLSPSVIVAGRPFQPGAALKNIAAGFGKIALDNRLFDGIITNGYAEVLE